MRVCSPAHACFCVCLSLPPSIYPFLPLDCLSIWIFCDLIFCFLCGLTFVRNSHLEEGEERSTRAGEVEETEPRRARAWPPHKHTHALLVFVCVCVCQGRWYGYRRPSACKHTSTHKPYIPFDSAQQTDAVAQAHTLTHLPVTFPSLSHMKTAAGRSPDTLR